MYQVQDKGWVTRGLWTVTNYDWEEAQSNCTIKYNARTTKVFSLEEIQTPHSE